MTLQVILTWSLVHLYLYLWRHLWIWFLFLHKNWFNFSLYRWRWLSCLFKLFNSLGHLFLSQSLFLLNRKAMIYDFVKLWKLIRCLTHFKHNWLFSLHFLLALGSLLLLFYAYFWWVIIAKGFSTELGHVLPICLTKLVFFHF